MGVYRGKKFVIVDLASTIEGDGKKVYLIPSPIRVPNLPLLIRCAEGRFGCDFKEVVVCCYPNGGAIKPFWIFDSPYSPGGIRMPQNCHALYSVAHDAAITIRAEPDGRLTVVRHEVRATAQDKLSGAWIRSEVLYEGALSRLAESGFHQYEEAARAAIIKVSEPSFSVCYADRG